MEVDDLEVMWIKVMPKKTPRKLSCILVACLYYTPKTEYLKIRDHLITSIDTVMRKHPECGVIITGDFNQLRDNFMKTHYRFVQVVNVVTRGQAILDKIWTNMEEVYTPPVTISELGSSDHNMVLLKPKAKSSVDTGCVTRFWGVWGQKKKPHSIWLYQPLNGNPYLGLIHVQINIHIIKRLLAT